MKRKKKRVNANREASNTIAALTAKMIGYADAHVQVACEVVTYAKDGISQRRLEMLSNAVSHAFNVKVLGKLISTMEVKVND